MTVDEFISIDPEKNDCVLTATLLNTFERVAAEISSKSNLLPLDVETFLTNIRGIVHNQASPSEYFSDLGFGAFKECYESGLGDWIIKFCSENNHTGAERQILEAAQEAGLSMLFIPTYFIDLPFKLKATLLDDDELQEYDENNHTFFVPEDSFQYLVSCELQPYVEIESKHDHLTCDGITSYTEAPLYYNSGEKVPYESYVDTGMTSIGWIQDVIHAYGDDVFNSFRKFIDEFCISDLHSSNIGYQMVDGKRFPIIIDWLSR